MIADDFVEFGGNGRTYNKSDALAMMRHHAPRIFALEEFNVREIAPQIALVTYQVQSQSIDGGQAVSQYAVRSGCSAKANGK